jgi:hypothetical protein
MAVCEICDTSTRPSDVPTRSMNVYVHVQDSFGREELFLQDLRRIFNCARPLL